MYRSIMLAVLTISSANVFSQDAASIAAQREAEERERRTTAAMTRLEEANAVQQRRINELITDLANLRRQLAESEGRSKTTQYNFATKEDLRKVYDKMAEIEKNRQADNNLVKDQFAELKKLLDKPPVVIQAPAPAPRDRDRDRDQDAKPSKPNTTDTEPQVQEFIGEFYPYKIKSGDRLTQIIAAYNAELKSQGKNKAPITLDMIKKANPKLNPNNLLVGREIKIPIPPDR